MNWWNDDVCTFLFFIDSDFGFQSHLLNMSDDPWPEI